MARALINPQHKGTAGGEVTMSAVTADGIAFFLTRTGKLLVNNGSVGSIDVTFVTPLAVDAGAIPSKVVAVPAGELWEFDGFDRHPEYRQSDGTIYVDFSAFTDIGVAVLD